MDVKYQIIEERQIKRKAGKGRCRMLLKNDAGSVPFLQFPALAELPMIKHGFSTRIGGVSEGIWASLNLSYTRGDDRSAVDENFRRMADSLGVDADRYVFSQQTHTTNVRVVTEADAGAGFLRERGYTDVDGLVTNVPGLVLTTFFADCVPLYFADPVHRAIGMSHSGWRGTVGRIGKVTVETMKREYGTNSSDLICAIGPSICQDCYEISGDVAAEFEREFSGHQDEILQNKGNGKYHLDLWRVNEIILEEAGVPKEQISTTDICTCCNPGILFSHRASQGKRGNLCGFLSLV